MKWFVYRKGLLVAQVRMAEDAAAVMVLIGDRVENNARDPVLTDADEEQVSESYESGALLILERDAKAKARRRARRRKA